RFEGGSPPGHCRARTANREERPRARREATAIAPLRTLDSSLDIAARLFRTKRTGDALEEVSDSTESRKRSAVMRKNGMAMTLAACAVMGIGMVAVGDDYAIDPVHSGVTFQIRHMDISWVPGRFDRFSGEFTVDTADPTKSSFKMTIKTDSVDTNNAGRDG